MSSHASGPERAARKLGPRDPRFRRDHHMADARRYRARMLESAGWTRAAWESAVREYVRLARAENWRLVGMKLLRALRR